MSALPASWELHIYNFDVVSARPLETGHASHASRAGWVDCCHPPTRQASKQASKKQAHNQMKTAKVVIDMLD